MKPACPAQLAYDLPAIARSWGAFAGILAGFGFAAIVQILMRSTDDPERRARVVVAMVSSFISLLLATILYAVLNGEWSTSASGLQTLADGRATTEELLAGITLGFAALTLLYAIVLMVDGHLPLASGHIRILVGVLIPPLVVLQVNLGGQDNLFAELVRRPGDKRPCPHSAYNAFTFWGLWLPTAFVMISALIGLLLQRRRITLPSAVHDVVPYLALILALGATVWFSTLSEFSDSIRLTHAELYSFAWITALFAAVIAVLTVVPIAIAPYVSEDPGDNREQAGVSPSMPSSAS